MAEQEDGNRRRREAEAPVVALECVAGSSKAEEWGGGGGVVQEGDVVEAVRVGRGSRGGGTATALELEAPFKGGRAGLHKALHAAFKRGDTSVEVRVRGGRELQACIVPHHASPGGGGGGGGGRKQYVLRSMHDPNYVLGFVDRLESECLVLQGTRSTRVASALSKAQLQDGYVAYPWEKKMRDTLRMPNSSCYLSMLVLPKALDSNACRYESFDDTLARANAWICSAQASGIPVDYRNVQSEALLTKISGETASATVNSGSLSDLSNVTNATLYGFEDYHGVDIGVVKAARLWYSSIGELLLEIPLEEGDTRLGFAISRTEEGFIYISSVVDDEECKGPSSRSGLRDLFNRAKEASKLLVISRVSNEKVLPWMISSSGSVRCFDTISLSQKLSLHRLAVRPIELHLLAWEKPAGPVERIFHSPKLPLPSTLLPQPHQNVVTESVEPRVDAEQDYVGDLSFRLDDISFESSWV
ncbi:hypothetical protein SEVIR_2G264200v4 [Setaria viridis]|uniref:Uncharacterized protein n=1 Tax=Setaria viridis TaxID=4556 RepID=A0A4U6VXK8_SETVI|nr:uncharacterized protein LOC117843047 [Setaria viridis]TKW33814.1 hypothetical protein SEVIR_2G264200v2 [Setaria viridis]